MPTRATVLHGPPCAASVLITLAAAASCGDDPVAPRTSIEVSGDVVLQDGFAIPDGARVIVAWFGEDEQILRAFGEAPLPMGSTTFRVTLDEPPTFARPFGVGLGFLLVTTDPGIGEGDPVDVDAMDGAAGWHAVVWVDEESPALDGPDWLGGFRPGYSVGRGVVRGPGEFDAFVPVAADAVILEIGDIDVIEFVNWT